MISLPTVTTVSLRDSLRDRLIDSSQGERRGSERVRRNGNVRENISGKVRY